MKKLFGYIISLIGIFGIVIYTFPEIAAYSEIPTQFMGMPLLIISVIIAAIGIFFVVKAGSHKQAKEVPIYHGNKIVGYRQH